jgi:hypothetical protein
VVSELYLQASPMRAVDKEVAVDRRSAVDSRDLRDLVDRSGARGLADTARTIRMPVLKGSKISIHAGERVGPTNSFGVLQGRARLMERE